MTIISKISWKDIFIKSLVATLLSLEFRNYFEIQVYKLTQMNKFDHMLLSVKQSHHKLS